ncbi:MAG: 30S ribosomal protein S16 [Alphaproteobacteria bacterium]|nr:30S ribosomal protein S16 [Alphaproteobacteria bacterium]MBL6776134.1 30S ribosomal protein S16 [Alphaproteobacteria bacterium]
MALKIRLSRGGSKKRPFYRIVVAEAAAPRDGRYVERIGHYNPMVAKDNEQRLVVDGERVKHWMGLGAKPTERVQKLLSALSLTAPVEMRDQPKKSAPGKKRAEREAEEAAAAEAAAAEAAAAAAEAPAEEAPAAEAPAAEAPAEETPAEEAPAEEATAEAEAPAAEAAAEEDKPAEA